MAPGVIERLGRGDASTPDRYVVNHGVAFLLAKLDEGPRKGRCELRAPRSGRGPILGHEHERGRSVQGRSVQGRRVFASAWLGELR
jgi:hypothetical protein